MSDVVLAGALLGVLSRIEERTPGFSVGISSDVTWLAVAFLVGASQRGRAASRSAACGAVCLTAANGVYYAWIAITEPRVPLAAVAGSPLVWLGLGACGGALIALAGRVWSAAPPGVARVLAATPLVAVGIAEGMPAARGGPKADAVALLAGLLLLGWSAATPRARVTASGVGASLLLSVYAWRLEELLP